MDFDDCRREVSFKDICYLIQNKVELNNSSKAYIKEIEQFFRNASKSIDLILNPGEDGGYYCMSPLLKKIIETYQQSPFIVSQRNLSELKKEFDLISFNLSNLKKNPYKFYETIDSKKTFNILNEYSKKLKRFNEYTSNRKLAKDEWISFIR